ncbi:MAG: STAS domain-containing protein [Candidatus Hydrogenedentota bacterium]
MADLIFDIEERKGLTILNIKGDIDASNVTQLGKTLDELKDSGKINLIINLKDLGHINSRGFGILVHRYQVFSGMGGSIKICSLSEHNMMIFNILGGTQIFNIYNSIEDIIGK